MKINYLDNNPREIQLEEDLPPYMTEAVADDIAEIFSTPLTGSSTGIIPIKITELKSYTSLVKSLTGTLRLM